VLNDPKAFQGINPCGYKSSVMTNLENELGIKIELNEFNNQLKKQLLNIL
jgi:lipoyl(octanoyl) transferase